MITLNPAQTPEDIAAVKQIFLEYLAFVEDWLGESLDFQDTEAEFADFPARYDALFLARLNGEAVAACGVKPFDAGRCELKRLYCQPSARGHNLGERLCRAAILEAKVQGYTTMLLDTDHGLVHANRVYERLGFIDIPRYYDNPMDSRFMALNLNEKPGDRAGGIA